MRIEVYDIEVLSNLFTYTGFNRITKEWCQFVIHSSRNDYKKLINHLLNDKLLQIGFNNCNYDYPIIHHLINHRQEYTNLSGKELAQKIYKKSQSVIDSEYTEIAPKNQHIIQIDVVKVNNWDNNARRCSLKHCEMSLQMENIEEMPLHHTHWVTKEEEIDLILAYNKHDVFATNIVFDYTIGKTNHPVYKNRNKVELRQILSKKYGRNFLNFNDISLGENILLQIYASTVNIPEYLIKRMNTPRDKIRLADCYPDYIKFKTPEFNKLLETFKNKVITSTKKDELIHVIFQGAKFDYGLGGLHQSSQGVFKETEDMMIIDSDVGLNRLN